MQITLKVMRQLTNEKFIERALIVHGDKYDYSKVEYVNNNTKVCIICKEHGEFFQRPSDHWLGRGCSKCSNVSKSNIEDFIKKAKTVHGDKYDYSKVVYVNNKTKVYIICPIHGEFSVRPNDHLSGYGCGKCCSNIKYSTDEWIKLAKSIHGDKYEYSKVDYNGMNKNVCIICKKHGEFWQKACNHIHNKSECPSCNSNNKSKMEESIYDLLSNIIENIERQKTFEWLKYKKYLYLDFYLPKYNIAIECQGEQHFVPINKFGGEQNFKTQQQRDTVKKKLCEENNIKLFYVTKNNLNINEIIEYINETSC